MEPGVANGAWIRIDVDQAKLSWPSEEECVPECGLGCNRLYDDYRWFESVHVEALIKLEETFFARLASPDDYDDLIEKIAEESDDDPCGYDGAFFGLDPGVASTVAALAAFGCVPFSSCNAGLAGGHHQESLPLVAFHAKPAHIETLKSCAEKAGVGLVNEAQNGSALVVFSDRLAPLQSFARALAEAAQR